MHTHQEIRLTSKQYGEQIYFDTRTFSNPILRFLPWPIEVAGITFPDGSQMFTAGGADGVPSLLAGPGISLTPGVGTITISATGGGGGTPAGADTQIQYNNNGAFGASSLLSWNGIQVQIGSNFFPAYALQIGRDGYYNFALTAYQDPATQTYTGLTAYSNGFSIIARPSVGSAASSAVYITPVGMGINIDPQIGVGNYVLTVGPDGNGGQGIAVMGDINIIDTSSAGYSYRINGVPFAADDGTGTAAVLTNVRWLAMGQAGAPPAAPAIGFQMNAAGGAISITPNSGTAYQTFINITDFQTPDGAANIQLTAQGVDCEFSYGGFGTPGQLTIDNQSSGDYVWQVNSVEIMRLTNAGDLNITGQYLANGVPVLALLQARIAALETRLAS